MKIQREETSHLFDKWTFRLKKLIVFFLLLLTGPEFTLASAVRVLTVQTGGSVVIPCYYDRKYTQHKKYWCFHAKSSYNYCSILAYANETKGKVSVIDHPDQSFFTMTMRNLQDEDTGSYWCAVEIGGLFQQDDSVQLHLKVQPDPDVSVMSSSVSGHEGDDVSVQCFYSHQYQNKLKRWCRFKDQSCYTVGGTDTSQNSSVQISDDGKTSFTVLMTGLRLTDSGWFWCSVGDQEASVQITVTDAPFFNETKSGGQTTEEFERNRDTALSSTTSVNNNQTGNNGEQQNEHYWYLKVWILPVVLLMMMIVLVVSAIMLRKKHNRNASHVSEANRNGASDAGNRSRCSMTDSDVTYSSVTALPKTKAGNRSRCSMAENDVTYSSVTALPKTKALSPVCVEDDVTYSSVHKQVCVAD